MAASAESVAAEGDWKATSPELAADIDSKPNLHRDCMAGAEEFETGAEGTLQGNEGDQRGHERCQRLRPG